MALLEDGDDVDLLLDLLRITTIYLSSFGGSGSGLGWNNSTSASRAGSRRT
jgi:hypothetical protein